MIIGFIRYYESNGKITKKPANRLIESGWLASRSFSEGWWWDSVRITRKYYATDLS